MSATLTGTVKSGVTGVFAPAPPLDFIDLVHGDVRDASVATLGRRARRGATAGYCSGHLRTAARNILAQLTRLDC
eukprot:m.462276 g.462276  ORF g.462276 m.462276 type:complete len:75 (-) comp22573_c0_seq1:101-325(-)